jgi:hypothetical protein
VALVAVSASAAKARATAMDRFLTCTSSIPLGVGVSEACR